MSRGRPIAVSASIAVLVGELAPVTCKHRCATDGRDCKLDGMVRLLGQTWLR